MKNKELMNEVEKNAGDLRRWITQHTRCDDLVFRYDFIANEIEIVITYEVKNACYFDFEIKISADNLEIGKKIRRDCFVLLMGDNENKSSDIENIDKLKEVIATADLIAEFYEKRLSIDHNSGKIIYRDSLNNKTGGC